MNLGKTALHVLGTVAPTILAAIGGPFGALAAAVLHAALGTNGDEQAVDTALTNASPETLQKAKQAETDLQAKLDEFGIKKEQLQLADVEGARQMQVADKDPTVGRLAWTMVLGFIVGSMVLIYGMIAYPEVIAKVPAAAWGMIGTLVGYLAKGATQAETFYFGSSAGSQAKDATLADLAKQPT
jgi:hypothetical protein